MAATLRIDGKGEVMLGPRRPLTVPGRLAIHRQLAYAEFLARTRAPSPQPVMAMSISVPTP
jgi:hypothetical protein